MKQYLDALKDVTENGRSTNDRTGTGTTSVFGRQYRYDLKDGLPIVTTKKVHVKSIIHELLWMLSGDTNTKYLTDNGVRIWNEWADENGDLGPVYGSQWRNWNNDGIDQIEGVMDDLRKNPESRRIIVNAWNPSVLPDTNKSFSENVANGKAALPPCHSFFQFKAYDLTFTERKQLLKEARPNLIIRDDEVVEVCDNLNIQSKIVHLQLYQRSSDIFLGKPFNITFYSILLAMVATQSNMIAGEFIITIGDLHLYNNHKKQVALQLTREPKKLPTLRLNPNVSSIFDYKYEDIEIIDYEAHPPIKGKVSI